ncbi:MAG: hypothetical protein AB7H88_12790 [Vicinamibacterales bacterium]
MIDREKVIAVLRKRFPDATAETVATAANAIVGLGDEWREVDALESELERHLLSHECGDPDCVVHRLRTRGQFKVFEHVERS